MGLQAGAVSGWIAVPGAPQVRLGDALTIRGVPNAGLGEIYRVQQVRHRLTRDGGLVTRTGFTLLPPGGGIV